MGTVFSILAVIAAVLGILVGIAGTFVPILPGIPLAFGVIVLYGIYDGFTHITAGYLVTLGIFTAVSLLVDQLSMILGMKVFQSDNRAIIGSTIGGILGLFIWPPFGMLLFCFLGAFAVEYYLHRDSDQALHSSVGALLGFLSGTVFKVLIGVIFLVSFLIRLF